MSSDRNLRRLIQKKKEEFVAMLNSTSVVEQECPQSSGEESALDNSEMICDEAISPASALSIINNSPDHIPLREKIKEWYIKNRPTRRTADDLLAILKDEGLDVPKSIKTLVPNREKIVIKKVSPGFYSHFGIQNQIKSLGILFDDYEEIIVDLNIDGLPVFRSSRVQLWPILLKIKNIKNIQVIPVGIYLGKSKPNDISIFLADFISEMIFINENGIEIGNKIIKLQIRAIICDSPAKAFLCGIMGHTSSHGCSKCVQVAKKNNNVLTYCTESSELITDQDFEQRKFKKHHKKDFYLKKTPLENINIKMVSQVPLDPMHLLDLGVTRKMILRLIQNKVNFEITKENIDAISTSLESLPPYIPNEFQRDPRGLNDIYNWKATEFRQLLLYTGILAFKENVPNEVYNTFLLLHCACRILSSETNLEEHFEDAKNMLNQFVRNFAAVFGENSVSSNVHGVLHLADCVTQFGVLPNFSAYDFENYLQLLKKYVRSPVKILKQIYNKVKYEKKIIKEKEEGFFEINNIQCYNTNNYMFSTKTPDNCCYIKPKIPFKITKFIARKNLVVGNRLLNQKSFFNNPVDSLDTFGICLTDQTPSEKEEKIPITNIENKLMCLPHEDKLLLIPMLHGCI